jgi:hypothetical protein
MTMSEVAPVFFCLQHHQFAWDSFLCSLINLQFIAPQWKKKKKKTQIIIIIIIISIIINIFKKNLLLLSY